MTAMEKVKVNGFWHFPLVLIEADKERKLDGTMVLRVEAPQAPKSRGAIDLVTVLDVSGSMDFEAAPPEKKISRMDVLKTAMKFAIKQLNDNDRLAIVAFNDKLVAEYTTDFFEISGGGRTSAEKKVEELVAKGGTSIKSGLKHAVKIMDARADKTRMGFIVLLSDGVDKFKWNDESVASTDPVHVLLRKYPVHTFGLSKAHDPKTLHFIAKESNGTYSSITDNLNSKSMEAFAVCLGGIKTVVAVDMSVDIKSSDLKDWPTKITRIDSGAYKSSISKDGISGDISIGVLYASEVKDFVVYFQVQIPKTEEGNNYHEPLSAGGEYKGIPGRQPISTSRWARQFVVYSGSSASKEDGCLVPFPNVLQQMVRFKVLDLLASFEKEFQALKKKAEGAIDRDKGDDPVLQTIAGNMLKSKWWEFKRSDKSWKEAARIGLDMGGIDKDITAMVSNLKRALGVACVYSWMSSYQMQRATTTGLLASSTAFLTPAMKAMVLEAQKQSAADASSAAGVSKCKRAMELLDGIDERLDLWSKLDRGALPMSSQPPSEQEAADSRNVATVIHQDIYLAAVQVINQWRISSGSGKQPHALGSDKYAHEAPPGSHHKSLEKPVSGDAASNTL